MTWAADDRLTKKLSQHKLRTYFSERPSGGNKIGGGGRVFYGWQKRRLSCVGQGSRMKAVSKMWQEWCLNIAGSEQAEAATTRKFFSFHGHRKRAHTTNCMNTNHYQLYKGTCAYGQSLNKNHESVGGTFV